ncbi:hypothetical protein B0H67DRAFT_672526 [Lasiosphaeris hirsuta]|uniref:AB hydrolase-1 domain-containing protein n=1 Tax=Lasiosphaeris hirsuta TaxID=260670 RepID=A0AA40A3A4_9PEZI|nr:hypothetical protein B0H67DRAFT_672526 [Lasiosphaeris hirsuta]
MEKLTLPCSIVAIHGLNGHPYGSWLSKSDSPRMWLQDFLPEDAPSCRIIIYGYKSNIFDERDHPRFDLSEQADKLIQALDGIRNTSKLRKKQIIFLAHSFGGLVVARVRQPLYRSRQESRGRALTTDPLRPLSRLAQALTRDPYTEQQSAFSSSLVLPAASTFKTSSTPW